MGGGREKWGVKEWKRDRIGEEKRKEEGEGRKGRWRNGGRRQTGDMDRRKRKKGRSKL